MKILITGGAGFIGCHVSRRLVALGHEVTILDNFSPQIHGSCRTLAPDLLNKARLVIGDVRDRAAMQQAIEGQDVVAHLASETGTGQSMYEVLRYEDVNLKGTATLLDIIAKNRPHTLKKIVLSSSRAVYGEGKYRCAMHGVVFPRIRDNGMLLQRKFEPTCPHCDAECMALPTDETTPFNATSFYGLTKQVQEQMLSIQATACDIAFTILRYQNVYGPGQSLNNPYTGILAIFFNLAMAGKRINIFEDGLESRDFVYISDVVDATVSSICFETKHKVMNVGSGVATTVNEVAVSIVDFVNSNSEIVVSGDFRVGDIRHNFADISRLHDSFGFSPSVDFKSGLCNFLKWALSHGHVDIGFDESINALQNAGMYRQQAFLTDKK